MSDDTTPTHAELVAAVEKARGHAKLGTTLFPGTNAQLDLCAAILNLHTPVDRYSFDGYAGHQCPICRIYPCPTVDLVVDALRKMGAL